jgi:hypothetical protein
MNYIAVLVSAIAGMVIGGIWYGPLFGKAWIRLSGMTQEDIDKAKQKGMAKSYSGMFVGALVMAYVIARFVGIVGAATFGAGFVLGFWLWLGLIAPVLLGSVLWENKSCSLWFLNAAYYLVEVGVMAGILAIWK